MFTTTNLRQALEVVRPAIMSRSALPIQMCVLFTSERHKDGGKLTLRGWNPVFTVKHTIDCEVDSDETVAINAVKLHDFISLLGNNAEISVVTGKNNTVEIKSGKHSASLRTDDAEEFPVPPVFEPTHKFTVEAPLFWDALRMGSIARLHGNTNALGECVALHIEDEKLSVASNSSFQVAIANGIEVPGLADDQFLMPPQTVEYLKSLDSYGDMLEVKFGQMGLMIVAGDTVVNSVRQSSKMNVPLKSLPKNFTETIGINFRDFRQAVNVVSVLMQGKDDEKVLGVSVRDGKMTIRPDRVPDSDTSESELDCQHQAPRQFRLRAYQIKDFLGVTADDTVQIRFAAEIPHVNFHTDKQDSLVYWAGALVSRGEEAQ